MSDFPSTSTYNNEIAAKKKRISYKYEDIKIISTIEELAEYQLSLRNEGLHKKSEIETEWEKIYTYECKETKRGCKYALIIRSSHDNFKSVVSHRICGHDHSNSKKSKLTTKESGPSYSDLAVNEIQRMLNESDAPTLSASQNLSNQEQNPCSTPSNNEPATVAKKKRTTHKYEDIKIISTIEELAEYQLSLRNEGLHKKSEIETEWEKIYTYECKETKRGCKYALIIRSSHDDFKSTVCHRICGHDHSNTKNSKISTEIRDFISSHSYLSANRIQRKLKESGFPALPDSQLKSFLNRERNKKRKNFAAVNEEGVTVIEDGQRKRGRPKIIEESF